MAAPRSQAYPNEPRAPRLQGPERGARTPGSDRRLGEHVADRVLTRTVFALAAP